MIASVESMIVPSMSQRTAANAWVSSGPVKAGSSVNEGMLRIRESRYKRRSEEEAQWAKIRLIIQNV